MSGMRPRLAKAEAIPAPICAHGPSLPAEPPPARVITVATSFTGTTANGIRPACSCKAAITRSVPLPSASGASQSTSAALINNVTGSQK